MSLSSRPVNLSSGQVITVVSMPARLDAAIAARVRQDLDRITGSPSFRLVLDMNEVAFLDSSGLGLLVSVLKTCRAGGGDCCLCCLNPEVSSTLNLTALDAIFSSFANVEAAIAASEHAPVTTSES